MSERKFIIKIKKDDIFYKIITFYIKDIKYNFIGYYFTKTEKIEKAKTWKYKKSCEKNIKLITEKLDPTKYDLKKFKFEIIETTDIKTLRKIKLKKIKGENR